MSIKKELLFLVMAFALLAVITLVPSTNSDEMTIILSPHFDDAVLSLGGYISKEKNALVVTFFTGEPRYSTTTEWDSISGFKNSNEAIEKRTLENRRALFSSAKKIINVDLLDFQYRDPRTDAQTKAAIVKNIESLIDTSTAKHINVYGPAQFGKTITHPDHLMLHAALIEVFKHRNQDLRLSFFFYEYFPYVDHFNKEEKKQLKAFLEKQEHVALNEEAILLKEENVQGKTRAIREYSSQIKAFATLNEDVVTAAQTYTRNRCAFLSAKIEACEIVYRLLRNY